jgi:hypothetical protein
MGRYDVSKKIKHDINGIATLSHDPIAVENIRKENVTKIKGVTKG